MSVKVENKTTNAKSLNPCCNGIYSMRMMAILNTWFVLHVLILVVMEYTQ